MTFFYDVWIRYAKSINFIDLRRNFDYLSSRCSSLIFLWRHMLRFFERSISIDLSLCHWNNFTIWLNQIHCIVSSQFVIFVSWIICYIPSVDKLRANTFRTNSFYSIWSKDKRSQYFSYSKNLREQVNYWT